MTVFDRMRDARTAGEVTEVYVRSIAEAPLASPRELGALRRGFRVRLRGLALADSDSLATIDARAPETASLVPWRPATAARPPGSQRTTRPATPRLGARLSSAPRLKGGRTRTVVKAGGGLFAILGFAWILVRVIGLFSAPSLIRETPPPRVDPTSLSSVAGWAPASGEIDVLAADPVANRERLRELAKLLDLSRFRIRVILRGRPLAEADRARLEALQAALEPAAEADR